MALTKPAFQSTVASVLLDSVRAAAALLVCAYHLRYLLFVDYSQLTTHRALWFLPYVLCGLGHQAVLVFFVLSGYLVGGHILRSLHNDTWSWRTYLAQRLIRLWVVLLPALILGGIIDAIALHVHLAPALYAGLVPNHITFDVHPNLTLKAFLGSAFFLQKILAPVFGSNGALWSLAYEFWYYLLFPLGLLALRRHYPVPVRILCALLCVAACHFVGHDILSLFPIWLLGALLAMTPARPTPTGLRWLAVALYCPFFIAFSRGDPAGLNVRDYVIAVGTYALLWVLLGAQQTSQQDWYVKPSRTGAGFSYSLYLVHTPLLMFVAGFLVGNSRWTPSLPHAAIALSVLVATICVSYIFALATEFRTAEIRNALLSPQPIKKA